MISELKSSHKKNELILIVEDDKFLRELLVRKIKDEGFKLSIAVTGQEALAKAKKDRPQLILLDLILPGMGGFEVLEQIRIDPQISKIPVIILSNIGEEREVEKGIQLGASGYLIKAHFTPDEIIQKIKQVLDKKDL
ncbi:MAG: response regulator [Parcubacteria group bacterium]|jgi:CheY-like chemotaxis protein|nr:response regulator [Parcubacteria group bacterium]|tara:strand:- start:9180 stop:9590 length:411 start_codon:yes stop_codon:yes gene_type:complete